MSDQRQRQATREQLRREITDAAEEIMGVFEFIKTVMFDLVDKGQVAEVKAEEIELMTLAQENLHAEIEEKINSYKNIAAPRFWRKTRQRYSMSHLVLQRLLRDGISPVLKGLTIKATPETKFLQTVVGYDQLVRRELDEGGRPITDANVRSYSRYRALASSFTAIAFQILAYNDSSPITDRVNRGHALEAASLDCRKAMGMEI